MMGAIYITDRYRLVCAQGRPTVEAKNRVIEADAVWRRGDDREDGVEIAFLASGNIALRDSRTPDGPVLIFTPGEWEAFVAGAKDGEFNRPGV
ncbi:DUF397 domain-containing protein [Nocardia tengchongensis]|uniref:DUF397 domain-containing protein n=1 Tax=Nocardia tengchongensis TaxID=2055889 RepID=UPI0036148C4E